VLLHRWRGVSIGQDVWIGYDCILETSRPELIVVRDRAVISVRAMLIAHFRGCTGILVEEDAFIGPGAIILPGVTIGRGAVVTAGSVVSSSVPPSTMVQGNPAKAIANCSASLVGDEPIEKFLRSLRPIRRAESRHSPQA
jgi:acetyltransferase-like isoleucine patch superfamily enzyme